MELPVATRYIPRRGKSFAYQAFGEGSRALVCFLESSMHLDLLWTDPHWAEQLARLAEGSRVVLFQQAGLGLSEEIERVPTLEEQASDIAAVMDAEGIASATLFGVWSTSMPVVLLAAQSPERVDALVLLVPYAQGGRNEGFDKTAGFTEAEAAAATAMYDDVIAHWGEGRNADAWDPVTAASTRRIFAMLERSAATPAAAAAMYEAAASADIREVLALVRAPTRVLRHPTHTVPKSVPLLVAELIPGGTFHELPRSEPHMSIGEMFVPVSEHLLEVVAGRVRARDDDRLLASILFTDVVSSTELVAMHGDARWRELLARHEGQIRDHLGEQGGRLVKLLGDGSMSVFPGPAAAIRAARAICADARSLNIEVRAGVHTGECDRRAGGDISGIAVHVAARVGSAAGPSEVWVSRTVRDLVGGSGLQLISRGTHELRGVSEPWELFAVAGEDISSTRIQQESSPMRALDRLVIATARRAPRLLRSMNRIDNARRRASRRPT